MHGPTGGVVVSAGYVRPATLVDLLGNTCWCLGKEYNKSFTSPYTVKAGTEADHVCTVRPESPATHVSSSSSCTRTGRHKAQQTDSGRGTEGKHTDRHRIEHTDTAGDTAVQRNPFVTLHARVKPPRHSEQSVQTQPCACQPCTCLKLHRKPDRPAGDQPSGWLLRQNQGQESGLPGVRIV